MEGVPVPRPPMRGGMLFRGGFRGRGAPMGLPNRGRGMPPYMRGRAGFMPRGGERGGFGHPRGVFMPRGMDRGMFRGNFNFILLSA